MGVLRDFAIDNFFYIPYSFLFLIDNDDDDDCDDAMERTSDLESDEEEETKGEEEEEEEEKKMKKKVSFNTTVEELGKKPVSAMNPEQFKAMLLVSASYAC